MAYDSIVIGAGLYGLYAARLCGRRGEHVLVLEKDGTPFSRATTINQARVHMGYHYPRSISTAMKSAHYFRRFCDDFGACVKRDFTQVYATSAAFSWTNAAEFVRFCHAAGIRCEELAHSRYFNEGMCDGAFLTEEYTYDAAILRDMLLRDLAALPDVEVRYNSGVTAIENTGQTWRVQTASGKTEEAPTVLNATYAGVNEVSRLAGFEPFAIKYELCELILCEVDDRLRDTGITVMDGPFFSIMPFGKTGLHSLTSVAFTPHITCEAPYPAFFCQAKSGGACSPESLANCDSCPAKPKSAWPMMSKLARKYLREDYGFTYKSSLFSMKPILRRSEMDDSRPTLVRVQSDGPRFISVLSGKINTVYDLEEVL